MSTTNEPGGVSAPILLHMINFYKLIYSLGQKMPKGDKLGINAQIEKQWLECLKLATEAAFTAKWQKIPFLHKLRIELEVTKRLLRIEYELNIINSSSYLKIEQSLCEISKSVTHWLLSFQTKKSV